MSRRIAWKAFRWSIRAWLSFKAMVGRIHRFLPIRLRAAASDQKTYVQRKNTVPASRLFNAVTFMRHRFPHATIGSPQSCGSVIQGLRIRKGQRQNRNGNLFHQGMRGGFGLGPGVGGFVGQR